MKDFFFFLISYLDTIITALKTEEVEMCNCKKRHEEYMM